jgi:hypothetical protein
VPWRCTSPKIVRRHPAHAIPEEVNGYFAEMARIAVDLGNDAKDVTPARVADDTRRVGLPRGRCGAGQLLGLSCLSHRVAQAGAGTSSSTARRLARARWAFCRHTPQQ